MRDGLELVCEPHNRLIGGIIRAVKVLEAPIVLRYIPVQLRQMLEKIWFAIFR